MPNITQAQVDQINKATIWMGNAIAETRPAVEAANRAFVAAAIEFKRTPSEENRLALQQSIETFDYALKAYLLQVDTAHLELKKTVAQAFA